MDLDKFTGFEIDLTPQIKSIQQRVANDLVNEIKNNAASALNKGYATGEYARGWTFKTENGITTVYNQGDNRSLSHLLEYGHKARNGKFVAPQPHIRPAYDKAKKRYEDEMRNIKINIGGN